MKRGCLGERVFGRERVDGIDEIGPRRMVVSFEVKTYAYMNKHLEPDGSI